MTAPAPQHRIRHVMPGSLITTYQHVVCGGDAEVADCELDQSCPYVQTCYRMLGSYCRADHWETSAMHWTPEP